MLDVKAFPALRGQLYGRNNLLINGDQGWVPGNVFGAVVEGLDEMTAACQDLWMGGVRGETLSFSRRD